MNGIQIPDFRSYLHSVSLQRGQAWGFRFGDKGTHTSRTLMLEELRLLLDAVPGGVNREAYVQAVIVDNCLGKKTTATRKLSVQRLSELYALNPTVPLFRVLRDLWGHHESSRPLLAMLLGLARDPILRITAEPLLQTPIGNELSRQSLEQVLGEEIGHRFKPATLGKIIRNVGSSWTQSGHLEGRVRKIRKSVQPTPAACTFALLLGYVLGQRGRMLFETPWVAILDRSFPDLLELAIDAKRLGLLDLKQSASMIDISFPNLLSEQDKELIRGAN